MASISIAPGFVFDQVDPKFDDTRSDKPAGQQQQPLATPKPVPGSQPLGVLTAFTGTFTGAGFNAIFRPNSGAPTTTLFPKAVTPTPPKPPSEQVLELNLTKETLTFSPSLGSVPNRGLEAQNDIFLNGIPYVQSINDVTNLATGKADGPPIGIHFEPGLFMHVPATKTTPVLGETITRMGSIPHGTTINASGLAPTNSIAGPPTIPVVDMTPFVIGSNPPNLIKFIAQIASNGVTPRLPQDLTKFIAAGTITQAVLDDPNTVLRTAIKGQTITKTVVFTVSTDPINQGLDDGTSNIAFLEASKGGANANADAVKMTATFWIETVQHSIEVPKWKVGQGPLKISSTSSQPNIPGIQFSVTPPHEITAPTKINVNSTQIQYSQNVSLNFAGLTWPHVAVATLVPAGPVAVPASAFN